MAGFATVRAFTSARDAWWSSRLAGSATLGKLEDAGRVGRMARAKERRWSVAGKRYLRAYRGLDGQLIRVPAALLDMVSRRIEAIAPALAEVYDRRLGRLAFDAWSAWPVQTGLSRSLIDVELEQQGETFIGRVVSRAPYTVFIKSGGSNVYQDLLRKPGRSIAVQMASDLVDAGKL